MKTKHLTLEQTILLHTYQYRCSTYSHLYRYCCPNHSELYEELEQLIKKGWLIKDHLKKEEEELYFLTVKGVNQVKPLLALNTNSNEMETHKRAADLRLKPVAYAHHVATLDFILEAHHQLNQHHIPHHLQLDQLGTRYSPVCPDGVIQIGDMDVLIEMDMGTERLNRLNQKMAHYAKLINHRIQRGETDRRLVVLFVYYQPPKATQLRHLYTAMKDQVLGQFSTEVDFLVGTMSDLLQQLVQEIAAEGLGEEGVSRLGWYRLFQTALNQTPLQPRLLDPYQAKPHRWFDYVWVKRNGQQEQLHRLFIDFTQWRASRLNTLLYLEQTLADYDRHHLTDDKNKVYIIVNSNKIKTVQFILEVIGFKTNQRVQLITDKELLKQLHQLRTSSISKE